MERAATLEDVRAEVLTPDRLNAMVFGGFAVVAQEATGELRHLDCSHIKLHQHGANPPGGQLAQAIGRSKGGLNTKLEHFLFI